MCGISWTPTYPNLSCREGRNCKSVDIESKDSFEKYKGMG